METKPNITPTPWNVKKVRGVLPAIYCDNTLVAEANGPTAETREVNAQAIVTAVNCTYGANINPEKIQKLIEALEDVKLVRDFIGPTLRAKINEALENIKYKD